MKIKIFYLFLILNSFSGISQEYIDYRDISEIYSRKSTVRFMSLPDEHFYEINKNIRLDSLVTNDLKTSKVHKKYFIKKDVELNIQYHSNNQKKYILKLLYNNKVYECYLFFKEKISFKLIDVFFNEEGIPMVYFFSKFGIDRRAFSIDFFNKIFNAGPTILRPGSLKLQ